MKIKHSGIVFLLLCIAVGTVSAQTTITLQGNVNVVDDPLTSGVFEGNMTVSRLAAYRIVIGSESTASGGYIAAGDYASASGIWSMAAGYSANSSGFCSIAFGSSAHATIDNTIAIGNDANATSTNAIALGLASMAIGSGSMGIGPVAYASKYASASVGLRSQALGDYSSAFGAFSEARAAYSTSIGSYAKSSGVYSTALGHHAEASGDYSHSFGFYTMAVAKHSFALGYRTSSDSYMQTTVGIYNLPLGGHYTEWRETDPIFVVGNGRNAGELSNALVVYKSGDAKVKGKIEAKELVVSQPAGGISMGEFGPPQQ